MNLREMRTKRRELHDEAEGIVNAAEKAGRNPTAEEDARFNALMTEVEQLGNQIRRAERMEEASRDMNELDARAVATATATRESPTETATDQRSRPWRSFGEQLQAIVRADNPRERDVDPRLIQQRAASGSAAGVDADGGYLIQSDFATDIFRRIYEVGGLVSRVRRTPISANSNSLVMHTIDETSRATGSRFGGVQTYWSAEADQYTASRPKLRRMRWQLEKLTGLWYVTDELMQDAAAMESIAMDAFAEEFAWTIENAFIRGTGAGQPFGVLNHDSLITVSKETGQAAATIQYENITKMWARMWARSRQNAIWLINQDIEPSLMSMGITYGTAGMPVYLPPGGLSATPYATLMGRPVIPVEYCSTLGTVGDIILVDPTQYLMIDKGGMESASSIHLRFDYGETAFRFTYRVDGRPLWSTALTPANGSNTLSPFIALQTRS